MSGWWLASYMGLWLLVVLLALLLIHVLRTVGVLAAQIGQPAMPVAPVSHVAPGQSLTPLTLTALDGTLTSLPRTTPTALAVISPHCGPCHDLIQHLATTTEPLHPAASQTLLLSIGTVADTAALFAHTDLPDQYPVVIDEHGVVAREWGVTATPTILVIDVDGRLLHQQAGWNAHAVAGDSSGHDGQPRR